MNRLQRSLLRRCPPKPYVDTYHVPTWHIIGIDRSKSYAAKTGRLPFSTRIADFS